MEFLSFIQTRQAQLALAIWEHIQLSVIALLLAVVVGVIVGILLTRTPQIASTVIGTASVIQTIPSLALLGFMIPLLGIGMVPAIVALFLYSLLPILRNTYTGIQGVDSSLIEAGVGMGMTGSQVLYMVELPLALPVIMAGIRTATVTIIGVATLASLIGAGGLGDLIFGGIAMANNYMIFAGAIPAAILALLSDALLARVESKLTPINTPEQGGGA
ncbi:MAG: ABC transporter permease [Limnochordia bacterium]|jgi:osmoprotectant transport system permease protein|nr:ABC transporter permease [Limnochordia bacterium]